VSTPERAPAPRWPLLTGGAAGLGERIVFIAAGVFAFALLVLAASVELAGALSGAGVTPLSLDELIGVLLRLPAHLSDPRAAAPALARHALPAGATFYAVVALVLAAFGGLTVTAVCLARAVRERTGDLFRVPHAGSAGAHWARAGQLRPLQVDRPEAGRLTLGRMGRQLLAGEPRQSAIVIAPTESMKTTGLAIPALLEWRGPALATSVKSDLLRDTRARRRELGQVMIYDPTEATGRLGSGWTPLTGCATWQGAQRTAAWLCAAARSPQGSLADADFWYAAAAKLLAPILFAAASSTQTMAEVVCWVDTQEREEVKEALLDAEAEEALIAAEASWKREKRQLSSIYTTTETVLAAYADPGVLASARAAEITPGRLLDGGAHTVYLCAPSHEQQRLRPLFTTLVRQLITAVYDRAALTGRPLEPPLLVVLDEAANIAPLEDLDTLASTAAGQGIQLLSVFQDLAQLRERWGVRAATIVNNHRAKLIGSGISDPDTLEYAARVLGDQELRERSQTAGQEGNASLTEWSVYRTLTPPHELRQADRGSALLIYGNLPPVRLGLRPWFAERELRRLAAAGRRDT
jgi:type IV secretion system protein VirD4